MRLIEKIWYSPFSWQSALLLPLSGLFALISAARRACFRCGILQSQPLPVPVVVVGNLTVGGAGKTPLTLYLARKLIERGWSPGIISRGYQGEATRPLAVHPDSDPILCGDEPILLARVAPVFVCRKRIEAGKALLAAHPDVNVILCDDGLQHYHLARDIELCVVDGARGFGNALPLPAGPLREPVSRLKGVDAVVVNGPGCVPVHPHAFQMTLETDPFYHLSDPQRIASVAEMAGLKLAAMCGIGNPARFFSTLKALGLVFSEHPLHDHHHYAVSDLPEADLILVTEKDAVKLATLPDLGLLGDKIRVLPVSARLEPDLAAWLIGKLNHGRQTS